MTITRFAPSPTGLLHVGNVRTALINYLFTKKNHGTFMLRMDDTDIMRSKEEYATAIEQDLKWLGFEWDIFAKQSDRLDRYEEIKQKLLASGRLYRCYESQEELEIKRKMQLSRGMPPIYERGALKLTEEQKNQFEAEGKKPHYRFLLKDEPIIWQDQIRGETHFEGKNLSDPILVREDGSMTYILSSVIDDIDYKITNIIRGEDHVTNTAIQIQIFAALNSTAPNFAHLALIKSKDAEISKRTGGFDIKSLRESGIVAMAISSMFASIGTSGSIEPCTSLEELVAAFDISKFGRAPASYDQEDLLRLNHKILSITNFAEIKSQLKDLAITDIDENFWLSVRSNIKTLNELSDWYKICKEPLKPEIEDVDLLKQAIELFPGGELDETTWGNWTKLLQEASGKKGKALFMPLRKALTAMEHGPELKMMLPLIGRDKIIKRLSGETA